MKKLLLTLGSAAMVSAPLATVVACGNDKKADSTFYIYGLELKDPIYSDETPMDEYSGTKLFTSKTKIDSYLQSDTDWLQPSSMYSVDGHDFTTRSLAEDYLRIEAIELFESVTITDSAHFDFEDNKSYDFTEADGVMNIYENQSGGYSNNWTNSLESFVSTEPSLAWYHNFYTPDKSYPTRSELEKELINEYIIYLGDENFLDPDVEDVDYWIDLSSQSDANGAHRNKDVVIANMDMFEMAEMYTMVSHPSQGTLPTLTGETYWEVWNDFVDYVTVDVKTVLDSNSNSGNDFGSISSVTGTIPSYRFDDWVHFVDGSPISEYVFETQDDAIDYYVNERSVDIDITEGYAGVFAENIWAETKEELTKEALKIVRSF